MRIIFFGTPGFAVPSLRALVESGEEVAAVITQPDRAVGRGRRLTMPPVKEVAREKRIPVIQPSGIRSREFSDELAALRPDAIIVVAYGKIIPPSILGIPPLGCINVHGSLLPKYRGAAPIQWAVIRGERKTGITTMLMDEGLDTGDILLMEETEIRDEDNAETLRERLSHMGAGLLVRTLKGVGDGTVRPSAQTGEPSYAPPLTKEDGRIPWALPAREIFNLVRGTYPWPGAFCFLKGEKIGVLRSRVVDESESSNPGRIAGVSAEDILVGTGKGILALVEVKPEGRKAMSGAALARGRRLEDGEAFDNV